MTKTTEITVTARQMADLMSRLDLPADWTGVTWHWPHGDFTECADHITDPSWVMDGEDDELTGTLLFGDVVCDQDHEVAE